MNDRCKGAMGGYTLVEFLIASFLGVLVVIMAIEMMLGSARVSRMQEGMAEVNQVSAFIFNFIREEIQMAGFSGDLFAGSLDPIYWQTTEDTGSEFDEMTLQRRFLQGEDTDCLGEKVPVERRGHITLSRYYVDLMPGEKSLYELRCEMSIMTHPGVHPQRLKSTALITGVESFQVEYGVRAKKSLGQAVGGITPVVFLASDAVEPAYHAISAIRIAILLRSSHDVSFRKGVNDVMRRRYQTTIALKNMSTVYSVM